MQIFIKTLNGKNLIVDVEPYDKIVNLKRNLEKKILIPAFQQRLIFAGKSLKDEYPLSNYSISKESTLHLTLSLKGGYGCIEGIYPIEMKPKNLVWSLFLWFIVIALLFLDVFFTYYSPMYVLNISCIAEFSTNKTTSSRDHQW